MAIDCKPLHKNEAVNVWGKSFLRSWLNGEFLQRAFTESEMEDIQTTTVIADDDFNAENSVNDKVFLLSWSEVVKYLPLLSDRFCKPTRYARQSALNVSSKTGTCWWWIRPTENDSTREVAPWTVGDCIWRSGECGWKAGDNDVGVRPALWVKLK